MVVRTVCVCLLVHVCAFGLGRENFHLFEDNFEQEMRHFGNEDGPVTVGLVFDASGSTRGKTGKSSETAAQLFKTAHPADEFFLVEFNERPKLTVPFSQSPDDLYERMKAPPIEGCCYSAGPNTLKGTSPRGLHAREGRK